MGPGDGLRHPCLRQEGDTTNRHHKVKGSTCTIPWLKFNVPKLHRLLQPVKTKFGVVSKELLPKLINRKVETYVSVFNPSILYVNEVFEVSVMYASLVNFCSEFMLFSKHLLANHCLLYVKLVRA